MSSLSEIIEFFESLQEKQIHLKPQDKEGYTQIVEWDYNKSCYDFYNVINILSSYVDEGEFQFRDNSMIIRAMDSSRIMLLNLILEDIEIDKDFGDIAINLKDLKKVLKSKANGKKRLKLKFKKYWEERNGIYVYKIKEDYSPPIIIKKFLKKLDIDFEDIPLKNLLKIEYDVKFALTKKQLDIIFSEFSEKTSEIIEIIANEDNISFKDVGMGSKSAFEIPSDDMRLFEFENKARGIYSKTILFQIKKFFPILNQDSLINISIKTNHPIKIDTLIDNLAFSILLFIAPRCEDSDFDDDTDE
jgi:hypothetical protein